MKITQAEYKIAIESLPEDGRWKSEPQLIEATGLGARTCGIYAQLVADGACERRVMPLFFGLVNLREFLRCYRRAWIHQYRRPPRG